MSTGDRYSRHHTSPDETQEQGHNIPAPEPQSHPALELADRECGEQRARLRVTGLCLLNSRGRKLRFPLVSKRAVFFFLKGVSLD